jgi:hypothetical protein
VPDSVAVPLPLSVNVTPAGSAPVSEIDTAEHDAVVTVNEPGTPTVNVAALALVMGGAAVTLTVTVEGLDVTTVVVLPSRFPIAVAVS